MISEVISRAFVHLFSFTTIIGVVLFILVWLLRFVPAGITFIGADDSSAGGTMPKGCIGLMFMLLSDTFAVFYLVVAISPKVLGFADSPQWLLPFIALFGSFGTTLKYLIIGMLMALAGALVPIVGRFQIFLNTMMAAAFFRVGYKLARPEGFRIGNDAYKDFIPDFSVSILIIVVCIAISFASVAIGSYLTSKYYDPNPEQTSQNYLVVGALLFSIIPIYIYGAWFSLKMQ